jgi:hypothetical protein
MAFQVTTFWDGILLNIVQSSMFHTLHTCPPSYYPQRHQTPNHFEWSMHEHACPLEMQICWHMHSAPPQK